MIMANASRQKSSASNNKSSKNTTGKSTNKSTNKSTARKTSNKSTGSRGSKNNQDYEKEYELYREISLIVVFVVMIILFLCNFGIIGPIGNAISSVMFGLFGVMAYIFPIILFCAIAFIYANEGSSFAIKKLVAGILLFLMISVLFDLIAKNAISLSEYSLNSIYMFSKENRSGGGAVGGSLTYLFHRYLETVGTVLVIILGSAISIILLTEKSLIRGVRKRSNIILERSKEEAVRRREYQQTRRQEIEEQRVQKEAEKRLREEEKETEKILRVDKKVSGVMLDTTIPKKSVERNRDDIHEIMINNMDVEETQVEQEIDSFDNVTLDFDNIRIRTAYPVSQNLEEIHVNRDSLIPESVIQDNFNETIPIHIPFNSVLPASENSARINVEPEFQHSSFHTMDSFAFEEELSVQNENSTQVQEDNLWGREENSQECENIQGNNNLQENGNRQEDTYLQENSNLQGNNTLFETKSLQEKSNLQETKNIHESNTLQGSRNLQSNHMQSNHMQSKGTPQDNKMQQKYIFPPLSRLKKVENNQGDSSIALKETAIRLQQTLQTFGVKVTITDISQGPSVTRYELQPDQGVKVSKIVSLTDDIKLNLAATDIRIEAPIPGKAAVGIEVPNKENTMVSLRELFESKDYKDFQSNLAFAVGKNIAGKVVVSDIAKMPHMLIAGSTGSGKSVCINTLIMSILYKAHPDDVKLIMVDPKVVELSIYNGIPHLLIPVVTDPKKASAALHWSVNEMTERYKKFADLNVRDLKSYNSKVASMDENTNTEGYTKMPQIVIIVDELADLMMVSPGEVEESICRLAQLARAAGIHLIIATQRPSVDVITGLIKANMPSRVAFAVSSGVDSRTILDMNGAEKLLGKGDMLFYPQGYSKPARIQGAFVSDDEVADVVDFLKNQSLGNVYAEDIEEKIMNIGSSGSTSGAAGGEDDRDEYFAEAGRFIIDKDKASIGMLQRVFKIGFNRAARIMDQLYTYGVVGEDEGTKPRKIVMTMDEFEQLLEEI